MSKSVGRGDATQVRCPEMDLEGFLYASRLKRAIGFGADEKHIVVHAKSLSRREIVLENLLEGRQVEEDCAVPFALAQDENRLVDGVDVEKLYA